MKIKKVNELVDSQFSNPGFNQDMQVTFHVPNFIIDICREFGIPDEQIPDAFHSYVEGAMNDYISSGQDCPIVKIAKRDFRKWCEENTTG
jgi:hypothetical protein